MNATYEWLYKNYAEPQLQEIQENGNAQMELLTRTLELPAWGRIQILDQLADFQFRWGSEIFALGVQMGLDLAPSSDENYDNLPNM